MLKLNKIFYLLILLFISLIFLIKIYENFSSFSNYVNFNELLINYEGGFIRRGLIGQLALIFFKNFDIKLEIFFNIFFSISNGIFILLYLTTINKFRKNIYLYTTLILSPATLMFIFYDSLNFFNSQVFLVISILLHSFIALKFFNNFKIYKNCLFFIIIPLLCLNIIVYDVQILFIFSHIIISIILLKNNNQKSTSSLLIYLLILIPTFFILTNSGSSTNQEAIQIMKNSIENNFGALIDEHPESFNMSMDHGGNLNLKIGGMIKIFGIYFNYNEKLNLFLGFLLSIFFFYIIFAYFIDKKIYSFKIDYKTIFILTIPSFSIFLFVTDFGRSVFMVLIHLIAIFSLLRINYDQQEKFLKKISFVKKNIIILFIFIYANFWTLTHSLGWLSVINPSPALVGIKHSSLMNEMKKITFYSYVVVDEYFLELPKADFMIPYLKK